MNKLPQINRCNFNQWFLFILLFALRTSTVFGQTQNEPQPLQPNQILSREMTGAETHRYKFDLEQDKFFQVRVEQKGVDVMLKLLDASGNIMATMDSPNGKEGFETLTFVAAKADSFILEVISSDAKIEKGIYTIKREASRTATAKDKRRVKIEKIFVEGIKARDTEGQAEIAIAKLGEVLRGWQELEDSYLVELTNKNLNEIKENKYYPTFLKLFQELQKADSVLDEGTNLSFNSKEGSLSGRAKLKEALEMLRVLESKVFDKDFVEKIKQASKESQRPLSLLRSLQFYVKSNEIHCLNGIAQTHYNLGEWDKYIDYKKRALAGYQEIIADKSLSSSIKSQTLITFRLLEISTLNLIGGGLDGYFGKFEEAINYLNQSVAHSRVLYQETQNIQAKLLEASSLRQMAIIYGKESKSNTKAIVFFTEALEIYRTFPDKKTDEAHILSAIATRYAMSLQYKEAKKNYEDALRLYRDTDNKFGQSQTLQMLGVISAFLNNKTDISNYFNQSLRILQLPDYAENFRKRSEKNTGESKDIEIWDELNDAFIEYERLVSIGSAYRWLENYPKSLEFYEKALVVARSGKEPRAIGQSLVNVGRVLEGLKKWNDASNYYLQALDLSRKQGAKDEIARDLQDIGLALLEAGKPSEALKYQNEALSVYQSVGVDEHKIFSINYSSLLNEISRSYYALGNKRLGIFYGKRAVNAMQGERQRLQNLDLISQKGFLEKKEKHYRRLADWLIEEGRFAEAEQVLRMLKEDEYSKFVRRDPEEINKLAQRLPPDSKERIALERYETFAANVAKIGVEVEELKNKEKQEGNAFTQRELLKEKEEQLTVANTAFRLFLEKELVNEFRKSPTKNPTEEIKNIKKERSDLQGKLKEWNAVSLYTVVGEERYRVILTTSNVQTDGKKEIGSKDLNDKVFAFREALKNSNVDPRPLGKELYDILIKPVEKQIEDSKAKTLLFSLDGVLRYVPIAALWDGKQYLVEKYQIVLLTAFTRDKLSDANKFDRRIFGGGVSKASEVTEPEKVPFKHLPEVETELNSIIRDGGTNGFFDGKKLINEKFTKENFEQEISSGDFNILHLATHFKLGRDNYTSFLLLGNNQTLTLATISDSSNIRLDNIDMVVLSACETAFGNSNRDAEGGEVDSSATFFELRGAKSVVASLWSVADKSTSELMIEFYRQLQTNPNISKAEALRKAQLALLNGNYKSGEVPAWRGAKIVGVGAKDNQPSFSTDPKSPFAHPFYWSPFILIGNWK